MNSQRAYLLHTLDAIDAVIEYTQDGRDAFFEHRVGGDRHRHGAGDRPGLQQCPPGKAALRRLPLVLVLVLVLVLIIFIVICVSSFSFR